MLRRLSFIFFFLALALAAGAQNVFTLTGRVVDEQEKPIEFANVQCVEQMKLATTNLKGEFTVQLESRDSVVVRFSMVGFRTKTRVLRSPTTKQTLLITLVEDNTLDEVTVTEYRRQLGQTEEISTDHLRLSPSVTGNGVEELIQTQAGVSTHNELSSQYNVRGGSFDENSVYINSTEVFRPFLVRSGQQEGLSIINPDMVERIGFSTGGFEAKYGDKMSSALDITYRRPQKFESTISASLLGASAYVGVGNDRFSWSNGLRYKTNSYLLGTLETNGEYRPSQIDYQTYFHYRPFRQLSLDFIGNISDNKYNFVPSDRETSFGTMENVKDFRVYFDGEERDLFRTYFGSLTLTRHFSDLTSLSLCASAFKTKEQEAYDLQGQYWLTQTETSENLGVGTYFQHARNRLEATVKSLKVIFKHRTQNHNVEAAFAYKDERINERSVEYEMRDSAGYSMPHTGEDLYMIYSLRANNSLRASRTEGYAQDSWRFGKTDGTRFTLNYGVRLSHWSFNRETILSPRASLAIVPKQNQDMTIRLATGLYYQAPFYKELRDTTTLGGITYANLNERARSQRSVHFITAFDYRFRIRQQKYKFTAEAYYKALSNLTPYSVSNVKVVYYGDTKARGHAFGLDMKIYGEFIPGYDSWLSLSFMNTRMKVGDVSLPLPTDQRIGLNLFLTDYFPGTDRWKVTLKMAYADGLPFAAPHRELEKNTFRAPAYKRVDLGMSYRLYSAREGSSRPMPKNVWLSLDGLNLLGINNVNSYYWITDVTNQQYAVPNYLTGRQVNVRLTVEL